MGIELGWQSVVGIGACVAVVLWSYRRGALSKTGLVAALGVGGLVFLGGGGWWFGVLVMFFVTSTGLGRLGKNHKTEIKLDFQKSDRRDAWQVIANGGVATCAAVAFWLDPQALWSSAFVGAIATANADTWATEVGILSSREPYSLVRRQPVPHGTSGAVSALGTVAALGGAALVAMIAALGAPAFAADWPLIMVGGVVAGVVGCLADSVLGATLQAQFSCPTCQCDTEGPVHHCGTVTVRTRGFVWCGNDWVNLLATACGAVVAAIVALLWR